MAEESVTICDVFARDGLQTVLHESHLRTPTTAQKVEIIEWLEEAGVPEIEITGFAHPKVVPSLADAAEVVRSLAGRPHKARFRVLVPNVRGAERAIAAGVKKIKLAIVASETYQLLNANMSIAEAIEQLRSIIKLAKSSGTEVAVGLGNGFVCPYEGILPESTILRLVAQLTSLGIKDITLSDSVGLAWPTLVRARCLTVMKHYPDVRLSLHLHTLAGLALANAFVAYECGVRRFDGSVGGIGGGIAMPVHTTQMANVATEDLVYMFESSGINTGIDLGSIVELGRKVTAIVGCGGGHAGAFRTLNDFFARNRLEVDRLMKARPGDSRRSGV